MIFTQWLRRFYRARALLIMAVVIIGVLATVFADPLGQALAPPCDDPPAYHADVPPGVRGVLDTLYANDLLYCAEPVEPILGLDGPVFWGSDGLSSWLFFQADSLRGIGVTRYAFGSDFAVTAPGDAPPEGYVAIGQRARTNQAAAGATHFVRRDGAPTTADAQVTLRLRGPVPAEGDQPGSRSVWRDLERLMGWVRGDDLAEATVASEVILPRQPGAAAAFVERSVAAPFAGTDGQADPALVMAHPRGEPALWQTVSGLLGSSLWVAGAVTETVPALVVVPPGGEPIAPLEASLWNGGPSAPVLALFAFDPLATGTEHAARFWLDAADQAAGRPPDATWPVVFP